MSITYFRMYAFLLYRDYSGGSMSTQLVAVETYTIHRVPGRLVETIASKIDVDGYVGEPSKYYGKHAELAAD